MTATQPSLDLPRQETFYRGDRPKLWAAGRAVSVMSAILREKLSPPVARTLDDVPGDPGAINEAWLTAVLCPAHPGAAVTGFEITAGTHQTTSRAAIRVEYNEAGRAAKLPTQLFAKFTTGFAQRLMLGAAGMLYGEALFYTQFRPRISHIEAPLGYWGGVDPTSWRSMILMEDIAATRGARFIEPTRRFSRAELEDLVDALAAAHGACWECPQLRFLKSTKDHLRLVSGFADMGGRCIVGIDKAQDVLPPSLRGSGKRLWEGTSRALEWAATRHPRTLLHGDAHVGQTYQTGDGCMGLCDWQSIMVGNWGYDYGDLVGSTCEPEDRRAWERDLLRRYLEKLAEAGGQPPGFDQAWLIYRQSLCYPCTAWSFAHGRAFYQPEMQPDDACRTVIRRLATAIDDLETFKALEV